MTSHEWALIGLGLWLWSHELRHLFEERGGTWRLVLHLVVAVASIVFVFGAVIAALRDAGNRGPFG